MGLVALVGWYLGWLPGPFVGVVTIQIQLIFLRLP